MVPVVNMWLLFLLLTGAIIFFALRFSRLARVHKKNRWLFGFIGVGSFLLTVRLLGFIAEVLEVAKGYTPSYIVIIISALLTWSLYVWLRMTWPK